MSVIKNLPKIIIIVLLLLMIPFLGLQFSIPFFFFFFSSEVNWYIIDFVIAGLLLLVFGLAIDNLWRRIPTTSYRFIAIGVAFLIFALIWIELAVGIFGSPWAGN